MTERKIDVYDDFATEYAEMVARREEEGVEHDPVVPRLLEIIGDVPRMRVLDAGCGEGYLSRILAGRGASVTGIDISPRLVQLARTRNPEGSIDFRVADLSEPLPEYVRHFDLIASHYVLNDVYDYRGFLTTLGTLVKHEGRLALSMNNPYSYVVRNHIRNYFDSGSAFSYRGMAREGVKVHFYQRTLEEYIDAALAAGFQLQRLVDLPTPERIPNVQDDKLLPRRYQFPYFMILSFMQYSKA